MGNLTRARYRRYDRRAEPLYEGYEKGKRSGECNYRLGMKCVRTAESGEIMTLILQPTFSDC
jgi:hypothetical protein